jgi:hypothetical protein
VHTPVSEPLPTSARLTPAQRTVVVALCRPYKDERAYATPSTNQQIAEEPQNQKRARLVEMALQHGLVSTRNL